MKFIKKTYLKSPSKDEVVRDGERSPAAVPSPYSDFVSCPVTVVCSRDKN